MALSVDELRKLADPNRITNHDLFPEKELSIDFCAEKINIEEITVGEETTSSSSTVPLIPDECVCCECCDTANLSVRFIHATSNDTSPPPCVPEEDGETFYDYLTDDNGVTLFAPEGSSWALKVMITVPSTIDECRTGILTEAMYNSLLSSDIENPILPQQLIVEPGETVYVLSMLSIECEPVEQVVTEDVTVENWPL